MDPGDWLQKALEELTAVARSAQLDPADAWRAATLVARLLASPTGPTPPAALIQRLPELIRTARIPDPQEVLDAVADELESQDDPWGPLMDGLLDADDALGVLGLAGRDDVARDLSARVAALVSLYPERTLELGSFAQMRLETVRDDSLVAEVWRAVERAPAQALADALPAPNSREKRANRPPASAAARVVSFPLPTYLYRAAADSSASEDGVEIETQDKAHTAWVYAEEGQMRLEVRGLTSPAGTAILISERLADGVELSRVEAAIEVSGGTGYATLGPWSGPMNLLHKLVADSGAFPEDLRVRITVADG